MKKIKLFKTLLIPSLGVLTLGTIAAIATSCGRSPQPTSATVVVTANADSTLGLVNNGGNHPNLQYSIDDGISWIDYSALIDIHRGQTLLLKGNNPEGWSTSKNTYSNFKITGDVSLSGNIMTLIDNGRETATAAIPNNYCFYSLFWNSTGITSVSKDFLPATELAKECYAFMFRDCDSLTTAPDLPSTSLAENCYYDMFYGCTNLRNAPELPATELANYCYYCMFQGCTSLTQAPDLPATTLANSCYNGMFIHCSSLTTAPALPATELAGYCYSGMFDGCTNLRNAPKLPATELAGYCYTDMFRDCGSLTTAPDLLATTLAEGCYYSMFYNCASLTTAPDLPATKLAMYCYSGMFYGCSSLNSIRIGYTGNYSSTYFSGWVEGVANTGTFYYKGTDSLANFGFPDDWSINPNW